MGEKGIIKKETQQGKGLYIIEVDKDKANKVVGSSQPEMLKNAIHEFLKAEKPNDNKKVGLKF